MKVRNHAEPDSPAPTIHADTAATYKARARALRARFTRLRSSSWTTAATARPPGHSTRIQNSAHDESLHKHDAHSLQSDSAQHIDGEPLTTREIKELHEIMTAEPTALGSVPLNRAEDHHDKCEEYEDMPLLACESSDEDQAFGDDYDAESDDEDSDHDEELYCRVADQYRDLVNYVSDNPCPATAHAKQDVTVSKTGFTVFQPYAHTEASALDVEDVLINTGNVYRGLPFNEPEDLDDYSFTQYLGHYKSALEAARFPQSEPSSSTTRAQSRSVMLICAPSCETVIGDRCRSNKGPDRYGRTRLRPEDSKTATM